MLDRSRTRAYRSRVYPYEKLEVGGFFFVPNREKNNLMVNTSKVGRRLARKFSTSHTYMFFCDDEWHPCEAGDTGAVLGILVTRIV
jgi:hypothetical protein